MGLSARACLSLRNSRGGVAGRGNKEKKKEKVAVQELTCHRFSDMHEIWLGRSAAFIVCPTPYRRVTCSQDISHSEVHPHVQRNDLGAKYCSQMMHLLVVTVNRRCTSEWRAEVCICERVYEKPGHLDCVKQINLSPRGLL